MPRERLQENLPSVWGDEAQLVQIILNLVINASEAIGDDNGSISLSIRSGDFSSEELTSTFSNDAPDSGRYLVLSVRDSGCGMESEALQRVFEPFFTTKFAGRGLGLSATQGIVRSHGGVIKVESTPGEGTLFQVFLPVCKDQPTNTAAVEHDTVKLKPGTVLVVDDEASLLAIARRMFKREGITSIEASDGREAIEQLERNRDAIDLVLLDLTMPGMGGEEAYGRMRRIRPDLPIIMCSGYSEEDVASRFADDDNLYFLHKPFGLSHLRAKIAAAIPNGASGRQDGPAGRDHAGHG